MTPTYIDGICFKMNHYYENVKPIHTFWIEQNHVQVLKNWQSRYLLNVKIIPAQNGGLFQEETCLRYFIFKNTDATTVDVL